MSFIDLTLTLDTPFLSGSVDPGKIDIDWPLRPSTVKGIWRWWTRALVAGVLFERGLLHGEPHKDFIKIPSDNEASYISRIVGLGLGLGYAGENDSRASCFRIFIDPTNQRSSSPQPIITNANKYQRFKLLTVGGKRSIEYINNASITLVIDENSHCTLEREQKEAAMSALAMSLRYSCFGKGGRRGLGCFSVKASGQYSNIFIKDDEKLLEHALVTASKAVDIVINNGKLEKRNLDKCELPPMPVISRGPNYIDCTENQEGEKILNKVFNPYILIKVSGSNLLDSIHNFFLRPSRAKVLFGNYGASDELRKNYYAWILGLPREQKGTGYSVNSKEGRRASPIMVAVHGNNEGYISIFTSADWPRKVIWRGGSGFKQIDINETKIIEATIVAIRELMDYLRKKNLQVKQVWP
ncbi:MAG: RAMP superfamily CRISPR-associated protein [Thermocladium sp.]